MDRKLIVLFLVVVLMVFCIICPPGFISRSFHKADSLPSCANPHTHANREHRHTSGITTRKVGLKAILKPRLNEAGKELLRELLKEGTCLDDIPRDVLVAWAARDPEAALRWIKSHKDKSGEELGAVAAGILIRDGKEAMQDFLAQHENDSFLLPKYQSIEELEKAMFYDLGREDTFDVAMEILQETKGGNNGYFAGSMILGLEETDKQIMAIDYMEAKGIHVELSFWDFQDHISKNPRIWADWALQRDSDLLEDIIHNWHRDHPEETNAWIKEQVPMMNHKRRAQIDEIIHVRAAPLAELSGEKNSGD